MSQTISQTINDILFIKKSNYLFSLGILFLCQFLFLSTVQAKVFTINKSGDSQLNKETVKEIILDYENYCENGCKYKLTAVKENKKVEIVDPNHIFIWTYVDNIKAYKYFSYVEVIENAANKNKIIIRNSYPSSNEVKRLKNIYRLPHSTPFITAETLWTIEEKFDHNGNWSHTAVDYSGSFNASAAMSIFEGI
ncbi:MAG: hypothetical protein HQK51_19630, partial [Oligoflexia bacterium]|nr:hypothetical protein [Oligoflexia bacterium]